MLTPATTTTAVYVRVSTSKQSIDMQLAAIRAHLGSAFDAAVVYRDVGVSGTRASRPGLDACIAACLARQHSRIVVWKLDRLGRRVAHVVPLLDELRVHGVGFVSVTEAIDTSTPAGRLILHVIAALAEMEREVIRERVVAGLEHAREQGVTLGRPRVPVDLAAAQSLLDGGASVGAAARALDIPRSTLQRALRRR